jgi:diguanylate cyclase (GGDEF)-like protein
VLERLRTHLESHPIEVHGAETLSITGSFGVAEMTPKATIEQTIEYADQALYQAKNEGRNRVCRWQPIETPASGET